MSTKTFHHNSLLLLAIEECSSR
ncbi:hypothetical protein VCHA41O245_20069 [Vibrio chagasii]|nr:hypothetical protein VCHA49P380_140078 [Vibrio chagasii]CAH6981851.1 hypothetical protein VCHA37P202_130078 [Vibrio chagasii]CAH7396731.1 hypothetical protein VCHA41O245_20069 [Vibrio chagasii]